MIPFFLTAFILPTVPCYLLDGKLPCPADSPCSCPSQVLIECSNLHIHNIPRFNTTSTTAPIMQIHFNDNMIRRIFDRSFVGIWDPSHKPSEVQISLQGNGLVVITSHAFEDIENIIVYLNLENNQFRHLPDALTHLTKLNTLLIAQNPLLTMDSDVLQPLHSTLTSFSFGSATADWFYNVSVLDHLTELIINGTDIADIPHDGLGRMRNSLKELVLDQTKLPEIPGEVCRLFHLQTVRFNTDEVIDDTAMFPHCRLGNVQTLELSGSGMYQFPNDLFNTFPNINKLIVKETPHLTGISGAQFAHHSSLRTLALQNIDLQTISPEIQDIRNLQTLDLTGSRVTCGCLMKDLLTWSGLYDIQINGDCSNYQQSVQDFIHHSLWKYC